MEKRNVGKLRIAYFIQEYTKKQQEKGISKTRIYKNVCVIYPMTRQSFYEKLGIPAKKLLKETGVCMEELESTKDYILEIIPSITNPIQKQNNLVLSTRLSKISKELNSITEQLIIM